MFTYPRNGYDETALDKATVTSLILKHETEAARLRKSMNYYLGKHLGELVSNHAKDITDTATGYFLGNSITYKNTGYADIEPLLEAFDNAEVY